MVAALITFLPFPCWLPPGLMHHRHATAASWRDPVAVKRHEEAVLCVSAAVASSGSDSGADVGSSSNALQALAAQVLSMLAASDEDRRLLVQEVQATPHTVVEQVLKEFDVSQTGQLEAPEAEKLFTAMARQLLQEAASGPGAAATHARNLLAAEDACGTEADEERLCSAIEEMAGQLLRLADTDANGIVSLQELAELFDGGALLGADFGGDGDGGGNALAMISARPSQLRLYELRGSLQVCT